MKKLQDLIGACALRLLSAVLCRLPHSAAAAFGKTLGKVAYVFSSRRAVVYADLKAALGSRTSEPERKKILRGHYAHMGQMFIEILRFPVLDKSSIRSSVHFHHLEHIRQAGQEGRGMILLSAHFGNWELSQVAYGVSFKPIHILARPQTYPRMNHFLNQMRETHGSVSTGRGMGIRHLLRCLRRGGAVGLLGDQDAGRAGGLILPFLGRKTTLPTGPFELALRTGAVIVPSFAVRRETFHDIYFEEPIRILAAGGELAAVRSAAGVFCRLLERYIERFPSQWLWETKRWKYSWTKRLLILSDGRPGHVRQSEAVAAQFKNIETQYGRAGMEYPAKIVGVHFKSPWRRRLFPWFALFFIPWAQGRLRLLGFFFTPESQKEILDSSADFVISAGAGLVPLNLCLAREARAKSIVVMKPAFPFNLFGYGLAVIPAHDRGLVPRRALRTLLAPNPIEREVLEASAHSFGACLRDPSRVKMAVFLGGPTRRYPMDIEAVQNLWRALEQIAPHTGDYVITTSRRTPEEVSRFLKASAPASRFCQRLVVEREDNRPDAVAAMMGLADILMVTEDSLSMISEAVSAGKKVVVLKLGEGLPPKHRRFQEILVRRRAASVATPEELERKIAQLQGRPAPVEAFREKETLQRRLQEIL